MGESNPYAINLLSELTGHRPTYGETEAGQQCLAIGEIFIIATSFGLWGDPTVYQHSDRMLTVRWGGQSATLVKGNDGSWVAQVVANPLQGKASLED